MWLYFLKLYNPILNSYSLHFTVPLPPTGRDHIAPSNQTHIFPRAREGCRLLLFRLETNPQESLRSQGSNPPYHWSSKVWSSEQLWQHLREFKSRLSDTDLESGLTTRPPPHVILTHAQIWGPLLLLEEKKGSGQKTVNCNLSPHQPLWTQWAWVLTMLW